MKMNDLTENVEEFPTDKRQRQVKRDRRLVDRKEKHEQLRKERELKQQNDPPRIGRETCEITGLPIDPNQGLEFFIVGDNPDGDNELAYATFPSYEEAEKNLKPLMIKYGVRDLHIVEK